MTIYLFFYLISIFDDWLIYWNVPLLQRSMAQDNIVAGLIISGTMCISGATQLISTRLFHRLHWFNVLLSEASLILPPPPHPPTQIILENDPFLKLRNATKPAFFKIYKQTLFLVITSHLRTLNWASLSFYFQGLLALRLEEPDKRTRLESRRKI